MRRKIINKNKNVLAKSKKWLVLSILVFVALVLTIYGALIAYLIKLDHDEEGARVAQLVIMAAGGLSQPLPVDAASGRAYIKNVGLTLPSAPSTLGPILYFYDLDEKGNVDTVHISSQYNVNAAKSHILSVGGKTTDVFEGVPRLQACVRGVHISFGKQTGMQEAGSKALSNGKMVYFFTEPLCANETLLDYAKSVDSY